MSLLKRLFGLGRDDDSPRDSILESDVVDIHVVISTDEPVEGDDNNDYEAAARRLFRAWNASWSGANSISCTPITGAKDELYEWLRNEYVSREPYSSHENLTVFAQIARAQDNELGTLWCGLLTAVPADKPGRQIVVLDQRPLEFEPDFD